MTSQRRLHSSNVLSNCCSTARHTTDKSSQHSTGWSKRPIGISVWLSISALVLSLLIIPFATELPEKVNSILWIRRGRDTLAFGNISGAMVFQGSLLPALGIALTAWTPRPEMLIGIGITMVASIYLFIQIHRGTLKPYHMAFNGLCYAAYVILLLTL